MTIAAQPGTAVAHRRTPVALERGPVLCVRPVAPESVAELRHFARELVRRWAMPAEVEEAVCVIVTELATNVVLHSGSRDVSVLIDGSGEDLVIAVRDSGRWKPREEPRQEPLDADACYGRGLFLVEAYASRTSVHSTPTGTVTIAEIELPGRIG